MLTLLPQSANAFWTFSKENPSETSSSTPLLSSPAVVAVVVGAEEGVGAATVGCTKSGVTEGAGGVLEVEGEEEEEEEEGEEVEEKDRC